MADYKIAVLLTCHNRCKKTLLALNSIFEAAQSFENRSKDELTIAVYLTDDNCQDGTIQKVREQFSYEKITVIESDGNAYWAGGMRLAWQEAMKNHSKWDFYLLINDDTILFNTAFDELFASHIYSISIYGKGGVYSGFVCDKADKKKIIYGAKYYKRRLLSKSYDMIPIGYPQSCYYTNANCLMVDKNVVDDIGILDSGYVHGAADWDYGLRANMAGLPVLTTPNVCAASEYDHDSNMDEAKKVIQMGLKQRKSFLTRPTGNYLDASVFLKRYDKLKYIALRIAFLLNLYTPRLYYYLNENR